MLIPRDSYAFWLSVYHHITPSLRSSPILPRHFFGDDEKDVPEVQVQFPTEELRFPEPGIEPREIVFQAKNDIGHGIDTAIHPLRTDEFGDETVSSQQVLQRFTGEIVE